ncbi:MAG: acyl-CoA dehydrogenase family protein [Xanthobacteraceae bacterium]
MDLAHLEWPFFDDLHRRFARDLSAWAHDAIGGLLDHGDPDRACRNLVRAFGEAGWLKAMVPAAYGGMADGLDVRAICVGREVLGWHDSLADFAFAMQGLGTGSISLYGNDQQKAKYLPPVFAGRHLAAFALSEPEAGSDVSALATTAVPDGPAHVRIDGLKTWISNGGIADHYVVFARTGEAPGARGLSAFVVEADAPGLSIAGRIDTIAPHPLATIRFTECRVPVANRLGKSGEGFKVAMATLDIFRSSVGAAALGLARRACDEALDRAMTRKLFGAPLGDLQMTQAALADSGTEIDAAALLIYRAAWAKDKGAAHITRESSIAKMFATEMAQRVIDRAVQLFGGHGVRVGVKVEALYREIRALRIYEGATEVQKVIIARDMLKTRASALKRAAE